MDKYVLYINIDSQRCIYVNDRCIKMYFNIKGTSLMFVAWHESKLTDILINPGVQHEHCHFN